MTVALRLGGLALLVVLSACTATPIPLPLTSDTFDPYKKTDAYQSTAPDGSAADISHPPGNPDGGVAGLDGPLDGPLDGACLECPLADGMTDGRPDAEAGTADALPDLQGGDLTPGE